ncbi:glycosyltransferase [Archangium lansingense]|uniref:glycosyltransferase n=1 Tax=Archangium lansingense TaxID=2995310 RepID=UPI003B760C0D
MHTHAPVNGISKDWEFPSDVRVSTSDNHIVIHNSSSQRMSVPLKHPLLSSTSAEKQSLTLRVAGELVKGSGFSVRVNVGGHLHYPVPLSSTSVFQVPASASISVSLEMNGNASVRLDALEVSLSEGEADLFENHIEEDRVLLVTPTYPSSFHLYLSGFVHARVREYQQQGLRPIVFCGFGEYQYQCIYEFEGVQVLRGSVTELQRVLSKYRFKKILVHFFDEFYAHALDRALKNTSTELILWCHGPETLFWDLPSVNGPYFCKPRPPDAPVVSKYQQLEHYARKYSEKRNVRWVFVSDWQRRRSEELLGLKFRDAHVIPNFVDERIFKYVPKPPERRKDIFLLRRYDNEKKYAVELAVMAIVELSKRPFFKELRFHVYGDGGAHPQLLAPIAGFENVIIHRRFLDHTGITKAHAEAGIALFPTRYDAQGVSGCEAASSGLVVVSSHNTAIPEFLTPEVGTLASSENPQELARIIERLYEEPEHFENASRRMSEHVRNVCSYENTIKKEISLIQQEREQPAPVQVSASADKLLTIVVPTYNMEHFLERCVSSLVQGQPREDMEVLIIDDGSKDGSLQVANRLAQANPGVVRVVAKENGGHGSVINRGIEEARGKYFRVVDSDDWVDSYNFNQFLQRLAQEDADVVVTDYSEDWAGVDTLVRKEIYANLTPGLAYTFDTLADPTYGFGLWGPVLATAAFKTECLRKAGVRLDEKIAYVDMEYAALGLTYVETVRYYDLDVYRYYLGRPNQTVSHEGFLRRYKQHEQVIRRLCDFMESSPQLSEGKRRYILNKILRPMIDGHYGLLLEGIREPEEHKAFDELIQGYSCLRGITFNRRVSVDGFVPPALKVNGAWLLDRLRGEATKAVKNALPFTFVTQMEQGALADRSRAAKYIFKYFAPYGLVMRLKTGGFPGR